MVFTSKDISANRSLKNFLRTSVRIDKTKLTGDYHEDINGLIAYIEYLEQSLSDSEDNARELKRCCEYLEANQKDK